MRTIVIMLTICWFAFGLLGCGANGTNNPEPTEDTAAKPSAEIMKIPGPKETLKESPSDQSESH